MQVRKIAYFYIFILHKTIIGVDGEGKVKRVIYGSKHINYYYQFNAIVHQFPDKIINIK